MFKKIMDMAYEISCCVEEATMYLADIEEEIRQYGEPNDSTISCMKKDLIEAFRKATAIEVALKDYNRFLENTKENLDGISKKR